MSSFLQVPGTGNNTTPSDFQNVDLQMDNIYSNKAYGDNGSTDEEDGADEFQVTFQNKRDEIFDGLAQLPQKIGSGVHFCSLHRAAFEGDMQLLKQLWNNGEDINAKDNYGQTPLHCAVLGKQTDAIMFLLEKKAKSRILDDKEDTPLHAAVRTGCTDIVKILLNHSTLTVNMKGTSKITPLHVAAQSDHSERNNICKMLLEMGASVTDCDSNNRTPLCLAVMKGSYDVSECLFQHAQALVTKQKSFKMENLLYDVDPNGSTLLHLAVDTGVPETVELCLKYGARVDRVKTADGTTPVHVACTYGSFEILKLLLKSVSYIYSYSLADKQGLTCLHRAAMYEHTEIVKFLLTQGIEVNDVDYENRTPLIMAASRGCTSTVEALLEAKADYKIKDSRKRTVLHHSVGHSECMSALFKRTQIRDMLNIQDNTGNTVLHYAAQGGYIKNVSLILSMLPNVTGGTMSSGLKIKNNIGEIPLHMAAKSGWADVVTKLLAGSNMRLIDSNDSHDRTPLHLGALQGHTDVVKLLLKKGAHITKDCDGRTGLHCAAWKGSLKTAVLIIKAKVHCLNEVDKEQNTALHMAAQAGHLELVKYLLDIPSQRVPMNSYNQNVLDVAIEAEETEVAMGLANHARWKEVLRRTAHGSQTQIQSLVRKMPAVAEKFLDNCISREGKTDSPHYKVTYDFRFVQGMPDENQSIGTTSLHALHTMVKYQRLNCLNHPVCRMMLKIKWKRFGLAESLTTTILFFIYVASMMSFVIIQPCGYKKETLANSLGKPMACIDGDIFYYGPWPYDMEYPAFLSLRIVYWICTVLCIIRIFKEMAMMKSEGKDYFLNLENCFHFMLAIGTMVFLLYVIPQKKDNLYILGAMVVMCTGFVFIKHLRSFRVFGLYITMILQIIYTFLKVVSLLLMLIAAFAFSFYMLNIDKGKLHFRTLWQTLATTFTMMLGELQYEETFIQSPPTYLPGLMYTFYILFCICVPIIFLNLLIGLAVGDIEKIQEKATLEGHARQVLRLYQIERGLPKFILRRVQILEYIEYPNAKKTWKEKVLDFLVSIVSQENDEGTERTVKDRVEEHEERLTEIATKLKKQNEQLEAMFQAIKRIDEKLHPLRPDNSQTETSFA